MRVAAVISDLMLFSRIESAAAAAGAVLRRVDSPHGLGGVDGIDLILVDWSAREVDWADALATLPRRGTPRVIAFGPHADLDAHAAARSAGIGPMWARSRLLKELPTLLSGRP